jgi:HEAT repeat protein
VTPVQLPAPMTKTERATLREQALNLLVNTAAGGSPEERANAVEALTRTPARLSMVLDGALQDTSPAVRAVAAMAAGRTRAGQAAPLLRRLMQDESRLVRSAAVYGLYKLGQNPDATMLAGMLFDASPRVRAQGAFIMGEMGEKSALGPLREAAKQPAGRAAPGEVRVMDLQIAEARVKLGDEEALADVRSALFPARPEDLEACLLAMQIVGQVKDRASVNRLIELTADKDPNKQEMPGEIRVGAAMALARLGQPEGSYIAREYFAGASEALRAQSAHLFGELGRAENLPILARMMADPDGRVRVAAASAVVKITERE